MLVCREAIKNGTQFNRSLGAFKIVIFAGTILYRHSGSWVVALGHGRGQNQNEKSKSFYPNRVTSGYWHCNHSFVDHAFPLLAPVFDVVEVIQARHSLSRL